MCPLVYVLLVSAVGAMISPDVDNKDYSQFANDALRSMGHSDSGAGNATGSMGVVAFQRVGSERVLSRQRRYVVFPKGSSIQFVYCMTVRGYLPLTRIFTVGLTLGLAWQLPTETHQLYLHRRSIGRHPDREHRVRLFSQLQAFLTARGLHGEHCVSRTVCEASQPSGAKGNFMEEVFRVLFTLPAEDTNEGFSSWDHARHNGTDCKVRFPNCSSIIDIPLHPPTQ